MTRPNRVLPTGELVALPVRGLVMGNRGILHDAEGRLGAARWRHPHWVCCALSFRGRRRTLAAPGRYTELFFLDEAVALAAGHRPCRECRRADHERFRDAWDRAHGRREGRRDAAPEIDRVLHAARVRRDRSQVRHGAAWESLPDGAFALHEEVPALVLDNRVVPVVEGRYAPPRSRPKGAAEVLTPAPLVAVLAAGYRPLLHPDALSPLASRAETPSVDPHRGGPR